MILFLLGSLALAATVDRVAAVVNDDLITLSEVYEVGSDYIQDAIGSSELRTVELEVLDTLIQRALVSQELQSLGMDVTDEEVENALNDIAESNGIPRATLKSEVERSGLAWGAYQSEIRESIRQMKFNQLILQPRIVIDDNALQETYRQIKQQQPDVIDLYGIFLKNAPETKPAEEIAATLSVSMEEAQKMIQDMQRQAIEEQQRNLEAIQEQFAAGTSFQVLAKRYDQSGLAGVSGSMGAFAKGQLRADLERIAFGLKDGSMSDPLQVGNGVYLLYVDGRRKQTPPSFEEVKPQLMDAYYAQRFEQEMDIWYETAKSRAAISVHLEELKRSELVE